MNINNYFSSINNAIEKCDGLTLSKLLSHNYLNNNEGNKLIEQIENKKFLYSIQNAEFREIVNGVIDAAKCIKSKKYVDAFIPQLNSFTYFIYHY